MRYEELTARPFWSQRERRPSQTSLAEMWLRGYLREGEKPSEEIYREADQLGFTKKPIRTALQRIGVKNKQGNGGAWTWKLEEKGQNHRVSS